MHYGVANTRIIWCKDQSCQTIVNGLISSAGESGTEYKEILISLIELFRMLLDQWKEYRMILDSTSQNAAYHVPIQHTNERGRPKFDIRTKSNLSI